MEWIIYHANSEGVGKDAPMAGRMLLVSARAWCKRTVCVCVMVRSAITSNALSPYRTDRLQKPNSGLIVYQHINLR